MRDLQKFTSLSEHGFVHFSRFPFIAVVNLGFLVGEPLTPNPFSSYAFILAFSD